MKTSQRLNDLLNQHDFNLIMDMDWMYDSTCTSGYNNDGSTGYEIFMNGFEFAQSIPEDNEIYTFEGSYEGIQSCLFFVGTEDEVCKRVEKCLKESFI